MEKEEFVLDLDEELTSIFKKEEMFAFFDVQVKTPSERIVSGLCKVTRPKIGEAHSVYFSLLFILDIQDNETWRQIDAMLNSIGWDAFERYSKKVKYVLPMFSKSVGTGNYSKEVCIYIASMSDLTKQYISNEIYPTIPTVTGIETGGLMFWEDLQEAK